MDIDKQALTKAAEDAWMTPVDRHQWREEVADMILAEINRQGFVVIRRDDLARLSPESDVVPFSESDETLAAYQRLRAEMQSAG